jgi:methylmalonyl-CoA carboxyltransferase small subunit
MKLKIDIDGKKYEADIEVIEDERNEPATGGTPRPARPKTSAKISQAEAAADSGPAAGDDKVCKSSIVGIVVKALVVAGQRVKQGETLLVLEAMKMESNVISPMSGIVKLVKVAAGDSVKKGQVLVEFD